MCPAPRAVLPSPSGNERSSPPAGPNARHLIGVHLVDEGFLGLAHAIATWTERTPTEGSCNAIGAAGGSVVARAALPSCPEPSAQKKWGPALLPAPTAPSEGSAGVRNLVDRAFRPTYPLSILAHQLRHRFPSCSSLFRGTRLIYWTTWPESSLVVRSARPGRNRDSSQNRPMFCGPSWEILYRVPLRSPSPRGGREPRRATGRSLFRRLFPAGPDKNPKVLAITCRRRSDLWSPAAPFLPFPTLRGGRDRRPDHLITMHICAESRKRNFW